MYNVCALSKPETTFSPTDLPFIKINKNDNYAVGHSFRRHGNQIQPQLMCFFWMAKCFCILIRHSNGVWEEGDIVQSIVQKNLWEK